MSKHVHCSACFESADAEDAHCRHCGNKLESDVSQSATKQGARTEVAAPPPPLHQLATGNTGASHELDVTTRKQGFGQLVKGGMILLFAAIAIGFWGAITEQIAPEKGALRSAMVGGANALLIVSLASGGVLAARGLFALTFGKNSRDASPTLRILFIVIVVVTLLALSFLGLLGWEMLHGNI